MSSGDADPLGRRAVFRAPAMPFVGGSERDVGSGDAVDPSRRGSGPQPSRTVRPTGKHALYSATEPGSGRSGRPETAGSGWFVVRCSSCQTATRVGLLGLAALALPFGVWLPGRRYDHWMTCPSCRRRTWVGITLAR